MSIEANTYEELTVHNINEKTSIIASALGEYLLSTWGIQSLSLVVDNQKFEEDDIDAITPDTDLYAACSKLNTAKEIDLKLRSVNSGGANWRLDSGFMRFFSDEPEVIQNICYRSIDYYDTDPEIDMYIYNGDGLQIPGYRVEYASVSDIREWYCYTPTLEIECEDEADNDELHSRIMSTLSELCVLFGIDEDELDDHLEDDWEDCGEIILSGSIRFSSQHIPSIITLVQKLKELLSDSDSAEFNVEINAVPDGETDYEFASVAISCKEGTVQDSYCRF